MTRRGRRRGEMRNRKRRGKTRGEKDYLLNPSTPQVYFSIDRVVLCASSPVVVRRMGERMVYAPLINWKQNILL